MHACACVCVFLGMETGEGPGPLLAGHSLREGSELPALSPDGRAESYKLAVLLADALSGCVSLSHFSDLSVPQLPHLGHGIEPGDGGVPETWLLFIFFTHPTFLPHLLNTYISPASQRFGTGCWAGRAAL